MKLNREHKQPLRYNPEWLYFYADMNFLADHKISRVIYSVGCKHFAS